MSIKRKYLSLLEIQSILEATKQCRHPERNYCMIYMSFVHGLRVSEMRNLRLSDLGLKDGYLHIHRLKHGFSTTHPLLSDEITLIERWLNVRSLMAYSDRDWLFISRSGGPLSRQRIYQLIRELGEKGGVSVVCHPHMLRHACGYALADRGVDTRLIQDYLGHRNIRHTVGYTASNAGRFEGIWQSKLKFKELQLGPN
ncbi:tyrosine-type DNA invertase [Rahnella sp. PAMC 25559]|uniref:tyrosine-type DNA invertase n=1 Tax=Rahnella sp. PAMC 25559 TaxID=3423225 RepID=UPI003D671D5A